MEFNDFLNKYKEEALQIDFKKEQRSANEILELKKMKLNNITFEYEIEEVIAFCEIAIIQTKETLNWVILNEHYKRKYENGIPLFLSQIKGYFEYLELYQKAIDKKQQLPPQQINSKNTDEVKPKKTPEKWYALLYWIELMANGQQPPKDIEGNFIKSELEKTGIEKIGTTGQSFYRQFIEIDINNLKKLNASFGKDWKEKIIDLSNNNQTIIDYIELKFKQ